MNETRQRLALGRSNYREYLGGLSASESNQNLAEKERQCREREKSRMKVEELLLVDSFGQPDAVEPDFLSTYILITNVNPASEVLDFKKVFIFSDVVFILGKTEGWRAEHRRVKRVRFGRHASGAQRTLDLTLGSDGCSRSHFELNFEHFFTPGRLPGALFLLLKRHPALKRPRILSRLAGLCGPQQDQRPVFVRELGSLSGTWLGVNAVPLKLVPRLHLCVYNFSFVEIDQIFHKEGNVVYRDIDGSRIDRREVGPDNQSLLMRDLLHTLRLMSAIYTNRGIIEPQSHKGFLDLLFSPTESFSILTLKSNGVGGRKPERYLFAVISAATHVFEFGDVEINFKCREFWLRRGHLYVAGVPQLWQAASHVDGDRFLPREVPIESGQLLLVDNSIMKITMRK